MTIRQQLKFSSILFGALLLLLVISNRLAAPFWLGTLLFILLILTTLFSIVQIISTLFHQWQLGRKEKWLIQHQAIQDLLTQGFKVVDHQFIEGTYKGFLIRVQYFRRQFNTEETNVQEYTGETVTTLYRGIKYSLFSQYTELDDEIFPIHYSTKHRLQLYMVDGLQPKLNWNTEFCVFSHLDTRPESFSQARLYKNLDFLVQEATKLQLTPYSFPYNHRINWKEFNENMRSHLF